MCVVLVVNDNKNCVLILIKRLWILRTMFSKEDFFKFFAQNFVLAETHPIKMLFITIFILVGIRPG